MDTLIHEVNGKKYLLVEQLVNQNNINKVQNLCRNLKCIDIGVKEMKRATFFSSPYAIIKILVPEEHVERWNKANFS